MIAHYICDIVRVILAAVSSVLAGIPSLPSSLLAKDMANGNSLCYSSVLTIT